MSTKKGHLYNMAWWKLCEMYALRPHGVTAGEFASFMGLARSTAKRWLEEMQKERGCTATKGIARNGLEATYWHPAGFQAWLDQQKLLSREV